MTIDLIAKDMAFNTTNVTVPAGAEITVKLNSQDKGIPHDFAIYQDKSAAKQIYEGDIIVGPRTTTYPFTAPAKPGSYFFRCIVHSHYDDGPGHSEINEAVVPTFFL